MEVIVGTYEEFVLGYKLTGGDSSNLAQSFADKSHSGALKCVAVNGHYVATGATDDRIFVYDMRSRKQTHIILSHEGTVNTLAFTPDNSHLLSGGADGRMIATRLNTWTTEGSWTPHNGLAVTHITCHPSGKMALSLGADRVLCTWNLIKGRVAYRTNIKSRSTLGTQPDCLVWSPSGDYFTLCGLRVAEIWSIKSADVLRSQKTQDKPICVCWVAEVSSVVGLENGKIMWLCASDDEQNGTHIEGHASRVKAMACHKDTLVSTASSGDMKMWQVNLKNKSLRVLSTINIGCRPTCLGVLDLSQFGASYSLNSCSNVTEKHLVNNKLIKKVAQAERGVVTIEYEEDNISIDKNDSDDGKADFTQKERRIHRAKIPRHQTKRLKVNLKQKSELRKNKNNS